MNSSLAHDTISIRRAIHASPEIVFQAWKDPVARSTWGSPSDDEAVEFIANDFRVGGMDIHHCGPVGDLRFRVETRYHAIDCPKRLLFTESVSTGNALLSVSLVTVDISQARNAAQLDLTIQIASLVGTEMVAGSRAGWNAAIANLDSQLASAEAD